MNALHVEEVLQYDGEIRVTGLPYRKGQKVDIIVFTEEDESPPLSLLTADTLLNSGIVGLWKDRTDLPDSTTYARQLCEQVQHRER